MIFWTWRSYFICWQIFENKVWCPVSKKRTKYFHFLLSLAYPIDRLDWALFSVVILFHHFFPLLEKVEIRVFILPRNFPAVLIIFMGRGGEPPLPRGEGSPRDGASIPARYSPIVTDWLTPDVETWLMWLWQMRMATQCLLLILKGLCWILKLQGNPIYEQRSVYLGIAQIAFDVKSERDFETKSLSRFWGFSAVHICSWNETFEPRNETFTLITNSTFYYFYNTKIRFEIRMMLTKRKKCRSTPWLGELPKLTEHPF